MTPTELYIYKLAPIQGDWWNITINNKDFVLWISNNVFGDRKITLISSLKENLI